MQTPPRRYLRVLLWSIFAALLTGLFIFGGLPAGANLADGTLQPGGNPTHGCPPATFARPGCPPQPTPRPTPPPPQCPPGFVLTAGFCQMPPQSYPSSGPPLVYPGIPPVGGGMLPPPMGVTCVDGTVRPTLAQCPQIVPATSSPPATTTPPANTSTPPPPATITFSGQNPLTMNLHANQPLDFTHSITINTAAGVQATSVTVSTGTATIQGGQVIWNGFTLNTGEDASLTLNLTITPGATVTGTDAAVQSVEIAALDPSGNPVVEEVAGGGPTIAQVGAGCTISGDGTTLSCGGSSLPPITLRLRLGP